MPFVLVSAQERLEFEHEDGCIYYHRPTQEERLQILAQCQDRGTVDILSFQMAMCQRCVDGWDRLYTADMRLVEVPPSGPGQREAIAAIVAQFPQNAIRELAEQIAQDAPEAIKKRWSATYPGASSLPIDNQDASLPASTVEPNAVGTGFPSPAIKEV